MTSCDQRQVPVISDQGYGRRVPPIFTPRSKPKTGIPIKATTGGYPHLSLLGQSQKIYKNAKKGYTSSTIPFFGFDPEANIGGTPLP